MKYGSGMTTPAIIIDSIGVQRLRAKLGVGATAVINAKKMPLLPGRWYAPVKELCAEDGRECPPIDLFNWSRPSEEKARRKAKAKAKKAVAQ